MLILPNVVIGLFVVLSRALLSCLLWIYYTFSIDICLVPSSGKLASGVEWCDGAHAAYVAAARNDHRYNNPIAASAAERTPLSREACGWLCLTASNLDW